VVTGITPNDVTMHILVSITEVVIIHSKKHISYDKNRLLPNPFSGWEKNLPVTSKAFFGHH
jgi:hypothetical protein